MTGRLWLIVCWLVGVPSVLLTLLIVLPAPIYVLWMAAVGVSEWSIWFVLIGLLGAGAGLLAWRNGYRWPAWIGIDLCLTAAALALIPTVQAYQVAAREGVTLSWSRYLLGQAAPPNLIEERDLVFATVNDQALKLDVYQPPINAASAGSAGALRPAVIVIHGGSWAGGTKSDFVAYDRWLAGNERVVFDVEYRLVSATSKFPDQIADVKCAIGWVKQHAATYQVDPERIALLGRSAGGQLALLAAYTPNDPALPATCAAQDTRVKAVVSFYGPIDLVWGYHNPANPDVIDGPQTLRNYLGGAPDTVPQAYALAAPIEHISPTTPPSLFLHGGHDQLVGSQHVVRTLPKLDAAGVPHRYVYLPWGNHGFDFNFNGWGSQIVQPIITAFFDQYL